MCGVLNFYYRDSPPVPGPYPEVECGRVYKCESSRRPTLKAGGLANDPAGECLCMRGILPRTPPLEELWSPGLPRVTVPPGTLRGRLNTGLLREADRDIVEGRPIVNYI